MKKQLILYLAVCFSFTSFSQHSWYVDLQNGDNTNAGNTATLAVKTINALLNSAVVQAGDTIYIIGQYNNTSYDASFSYGGDADRNNPHIWHKENTIKVNNLHGASGQYITIKPYDTATVLKGDGSNILRIQNSSYIRVEGFEIYGEVANIPLSDAEGLNSAGMQFLYLAAGADELQPNLNDVLYRVAVGTTIATIENSTYPILGSVTRPSYVDTRGLYVSGSHHIEILNNTIHHMPGGGMRISESADVLIEANEIYNCSMRSYSGTHALVVTKTLEGATTDDYSIKILRNKIHHNYNEVFSWAPTKSIITPRIDEGKGISLQRNNLSDWVSGTNRILVCNNVCYWNGFSGVHSNDGYHIDFVNNTCYMNSYTNTVTYANETQQGNNIGISTQGGDDVKIINNIAVIDTDWNGFALSSGGTTNLVVDTNIIYGNNGATVAQDSDIQAVENNTIAQNPLFIDATNFDFHLQETSPAIDNALVSSAPTNDYYDTTRDTTPDIGAVEYSSTMTVGESSLNTTKIYPNPFKDKIILDSINVSSKDIQVYTILGRNVTKDIVINTADATHILLDTSKLLQGFYIVKIGNTATLMSK